MTIKIYKVGGAVRDYYIGIKNKDIDYAVESNYDTMKNYLLKNNAEIFLEKPEFGTIRCKIDKEVADYTITRKDGYYSDGRRPDKVILGTIYDDLARRDFTMNAMARDMKTGEILDPFNGRQDLAWKSIKCVGNPHDRFEEDSLRMLRAIRFSITKNLRIDWAIEDVLGNNHYVKMLSNVSVDRIREELDKCFRCNTPKTLDLLQRYYKIKDLIFSKNIWLKPTSEEK